MADGRHGLLTMPIGRRDLLASLTMAAFLHPAAGLGPAMAQAAPAQGLAAFRPPARPMIFTRRLRRELKDGAAIEVIRSFRVQFLADPGGGYRVEGEQTLASVSAPPTLAPLARLEEQRVETALFPLRLDARGRIVALPDGRQPADLGTAMAEAFAWAARQPLSADTRVAAQEFAIGLHTVGARMISILPPDIFTGSAAPLERRERLTMPDGGEGLVHVSFNAEGAGGQGLLTRASRIVVTEAAGSRRRSVEEWTLEALPETLPR